MSLPEIQSSSDAILDVDDNQVKLVVPGKYRLNLVLPYPVDTSKGQAKFLKAICKLHINLPTKAPPAIGSDQACTAGQEATMEQGLKAAPMEACRGIIPEERFADKASVIHEAYPVHHAHHQEPDTLNSTGEIVNPFSTPQDKPKKEIDTGLRGTKDWIAENRQVRDENQPLPGTKAAIPTENQKKWTDIHRDSSTMHEISWQPGHETESDKGMNNDIKCLEHGAYTPKSSECTENRMDLRDGYKNQSKKITTSQSGTL